ncbi:MAG: hypothetical protein ABIY55_11520 [Kofleriaceae bacterium]
MRLGLLVFTLAACSSSASAKPAWPKARLREVDGGESLAPRAAARAIAAVVEEDKPAVTPTPTPAAAAPVSVEKPAAVTAPAASDEPITTEEIIIEIED